jgi:multidrug efflux system membrane fusion protein
MVLPFAWIVGLLPRCPGTPEELSSADPSKRQLPPGLRTPVRRPGPQGHFAPALRPSCAFTTLPRSTPASRHPMLNDLMRARAVLTWASMLVVVALSGCDSRAQGGGAPQAAPVDVAAAVQRTLPDVEELTARLEATEVVEIRPRIGGAIDQVHVNDGAAVARGALLFSIDPRPYQAELARIDAQLATARAQSRLSDKLLQRATQLLPQQAVSQQDVDQLAANRETAAAAVQQAEAAQRNARLNLEYTAVRAPVAGRVSRIEVTQGNLVDDKRVLTTLVGTSKVLAYFDLSEQSYLRLRKAPEMQREVRMGLSDEAGLPRKGTIDFVDNRLNPQSGTMRLRARFDNADGQLVPGLFARIRIDIAAARPVVLTPERAIGTDQNRKFVWVVGADNLPQQRAVTLGALVDGMRVLESGVKPGEAVVVGGLQRIRPGMPVAPQKLALDERGMPVPPAAPASGARS